jgi:uncharacterized protein (DUF849 family)
MDTPRAKLKAHLVMANKPRFQVQMKGVGLVPETVRASDLAFLLEHLEGAIVETAKSQDIPLAYESDEVLVSLVRVEPGQSNDLTIAVARPISPAASVVSRVVAQRQFDTLPNGAIHVRNPETGKGTRGVKLYREVVERIRDAGSDVLINLTTGEGGRFVPRDDDPRTGGPGTTLRQPESRVRHVEMLRPDICSLDMATMNFADTVFMNTPAHLRRMAERIRAAGVKPELEVFDSGQIVLAKRLIAEGLIEAPPLFQLCLGILYGAPATKEAAAFLRSLLPEDAVWAAFAISRHQLPMVETVVELGGHVRVGLEDNLYLDQGAFATNGQLVERAVQIIRRMGAEPAEPGRAAELLSLPSHR